MADFTPEQLLKLTQQKARARPVAAAAAADTGGLSAGDKMELMGGFERIVNMAISGSSKMGGREGILQQFSELVADYSEGIKSEMTEMFKKLFGKIEEDQEEAKDEPVKIDEKQFQEIQMDTFEDILNSKFVKDYLTNRQEQIKKFLKTDVVKAVTNNKMFKKLMSSVQGIASGIKNGITRLIDRVVPALAEIRKSVSLVITRVTSFIQSVGAFMVKATKSLAAIAARTAAIATRMLLFTFTVISAIVSGVATVVGFIFTTVMPMIASAIGFILFTVVPAIFSAVVAIITFLTPIAIAVGAILLKVLLVVAVVALIIFAIWKVWAWLNETFPEFIQGVKDFFQGLWDGIKALWAGFIELSTEAWDWLMESATAAWDAAGQAWDWLYENVGELVTWVGEMFSNTWAWLESVPYVGEVFKWIKGTLFDLGKNLHDLFFGPGPFIERLVNFILDTKLIQDLAAVGNWIMDTFKMAWEGLVNSLNVALEWWTNVFFSAWDTLYSWMSVIYEWVAGKVEKVGEAIQIATESPSLLVDTAERMIFSPWEALSTAADFWFGSRGGIVDDTTMAFIGEAQHPEMVIPLNSQGMNFLATTLADSEVFKSILNKEKESQSMMTMQTLPSSSLRVVKSTDAEDMEIPFADFSAEVVRAAQESIEAEGTGSAINNIDAKITGLAKMIKKGGRQGAVTTPIVGSGTKDTSNYVDMVAKGIIGN